MTGSAAVAAAIAPWGFWILLAMGIVRGDIRVKGTAVFLLLWLSGVVGFRHVGYPYDGLFSTNASSFHSTFLSSKTQFVASHLRHQDVHDEQIEWTLLFCQLQCFGTVRRQNDLVAGVTKNSLLEPTNAFSSSTARTRMGRGLPGASAARFYAHLPCLGRSFLS